MSRPTFTAVDTVHIEVSDPEAYNKIPGEVLIGRLHSFCQKEEIRPYSEVLATLTTYSAHYKPEDALRLKNWLSEELMGNSHAA